jgi:hypothetical protein
MEGGRGWVDPARGHKGQRGKRPKSHQNEDEPSKKGAEGMFPGRGLRGNVWRCSHPSG